MTQNGASNKPVGRIRGAWLVLLGQRVAPQQMQAEWVEYQQIFNDILERWSAKLARDAKAERDRIKRLEPKEKPVAQPATPVANKKQALRQKVAAMRGLPTIHPEVPNESSSQES